VPGAFAKLTPETTLRRGRLAAESELIPYAAGFPPGRRWLVLAPHPDDEVLGPGATLAQAVTRGVEVFVAVVTDGGAQGDPAEREREARAGAAALGLGGPELWRFPDRSLDPSDRALRRALRGALTRYDPDVVLVTSPVELHPDHRALALALQGVLRRATLAGSRSRSPRWVAAYEVSAALRPNLLVAADTAWEAKRRAVGCHASQLGYRCYERAMDGLAAFRALTLSGVERAEAFYVLPAPRVARLSARAWAAMMGSAAGVAGARRG
jgi:LmbE family N-acetylglucosaminyl deacetylase